MGGVERSDSVNAAESPPGFPPDSCDKMVAQKNRLFNPEQSHAMSRDDAVIQLLTPPSSGTTFLFL